MKKNALALLAALALVALPIAAQVPEEEPTPVQDAAQEVEQAAEEVGQEARELGQEIEQEAEEAAQEIDEAVDPDTDELPQTASPLAALLLLGVAGAGSALGLRSARRK